MTEHHLNILSIFLNIAAISGLITNIVFYGLSKSHDLKDYVKNNKIFFGAYVVLQVIATSLLMFTSYLETAPRTVLESTPVKQIYKNNNDITLSLHANYNGKDCNSYDKNYEFNSLTKEKVSNLFIYKKDQEAYALLTGTKKRSSYDTNVWIKRNELGNANKDAQVSKVEQYTETYQKRVGPFKLKPETKTYLKFTFSDSKDTAAIKELIQPKKWGDDLSN